MDAPKPGDSRPGGPQPGGRPGDATRLSSLARASAIIGGLSVVLSCCGGGVGGSIAVLFGMIALDRIRSSGGALRGRATAWAGIGLGVASLVLSLVVQWGLSTVQASMNTQLKTSIRATFAAVDQAGRESALTKWSAVEGTVLTGEAVQAFALEARRRYGNFSDFSVTSEFPRPGLAGSRIELAVKFEFSESSVPGSIVAEISAGTMGLEPRVTLETLRISDLERGEIALGVPVVTAADAESKARTASKPATDASTQGGAK